MLRFSSRQSVMLQVRGQIVHLSRTRCVVRSDDFTRVDTLSDAYECVRVRKRHSQALDGKIEPNSPTKSTFPAKAWGSGTPVAFKENAATVESSFSKASAKTQESGQAETFLVQGVFLGWAIDGARSEGHSQARVWLQGKVYTVREGDLVPLVVGGRESRAAHPVEDFEGGTGPGQRSQRNSVSGSPPSLLDVCLAQWAIVEAFCKGARSFCQAYFDAWRTALSDSSPGSNEQKGSAAARKDQTKVLLRALDVACAAGLWPLSEELGLQLSELLQRTTKLLGHDCRSSSSSTTTTSSSSNGGTGSAGNPGSAGFRASSAASARQRPFSAGATAQADIKHAERNDDLDFARRGLVGEFSALAALVHGLTTLLQTCPRFVSELQVQSHGAKSHIVGSTVPETASSKADAPAPARPRGEVALLVRLLEQRISAITACDAGGANDLRSSGRNLPAKRRTAMGSASWTASSWTGLLSVLELWSDVHSSAIVAEVAYDHAVASLVFSEACDAWNAHQTRALSTTHAANLLRDRLRDRLAVAVADAFIHEFEQTAFAGLAQGDWGDCKEYFKEQR